MSRSVAVLVGLALVAGTGVVHGVWSHRWRPSPGLDAAADRLDGFPGDLEHWKSQTLTLPDDVLRAAGARRAVFRGYVHEGTGTKLFVCLMVGHTGPMAVHRPEHCYTAGGFDLAGAAVLVPLTLGDGGRANFWTSRFERQEPAGKTQLRIFWSWRAGDEWRAPESPRWGLADQPYVYKLYVVRETTTRTERMDEDPAVEFLRLLLPRLNKALAAP